jgi:hypothetical protein
MNWMEQELKRVPWVPAPSSCNGPNVLEVPGRCKTGQKTKKGGTCEGPPFPECCPHPYLNFSDPMTFS